MKNKLLYSLVFLLSITNVFAQKAKENNPQAAAILQILDKQVQDWNKGDIAGFMRSYWNSPDLVFVSGTTITRGWQPTLERYQKRYDSRTKMGTLKFSDLQVSALAKDSATVLGNWALTRANDHPHGKFALTFRKFKEGWLIVKDHTTQL